MNTRRWLITLVGCVALLAALGGYKAMQIRAAIAFAESFPEPSETVETAITDRHEVQAQVTTIGYVVAPQTQTLRNELEGRVTQVNFRSGDLVQQNQVLIQLDITEEQARLKAAQARARLAQLDLKRVDKLRKNRNVSEERLDQAQAEFDIARADIQALLAVIDKKTLRAPFTARTGIHQLEPGDYLQGNTAITTLVGVTPEKWVDFTLPQKHAGLAIGTEAIVMPANGTALVGRIIARDSAVSEQSRNLRFRLRLEQAEHLAPNSTVNVSVQTGEQEQWVRVPATAVTHDALGSYVYQLEVEGDAYRARRLPVVTKAENDEWVSIQSGIDAGTLIAANGAFKLRDGLKVYTRERPTLANSQTR
ncbi:efflux RND transporter periplasmic adaptor subunit [Pseudomaricurvus alkylphenolicus]|uniref:efflux RND transporter periplasmic adaptor subunit n=1 Tax=Pseudomaricurvus alkylphenolicus TaxID=1306991 RepID=UPI00141F0F93|nr:efflux RND transporter periplasmic adaptor subunit [Pseudomaricurvus alkylphenolicus]NIB43565.1 efflux RND transporter periplasmic adaptor subunit [Pseudomaricurvus alkylphenolicus]